MLNVKWCILEYYSSFRICCKIKHMTNILLVSSFFELSIPLTLRCFTITDFGQLKSRHWEQANSGGDRKGGKGKTLQHKTTFSRKTADNLESTNTQTLTCKAKDPELLWEEQKFKERNIFRFILLLIFKMSNFQPLPQKIFLRLHFFQSVHDRFFTKYFLSMAQVIHWRNN